MRVNLERSAPRLFALRLTTEAGEAAGYLDGYTVAFCDRGDAWRLLGPSEPQSFSKLPPLLSAVRAIVESHQ